MESVTVKTDLVREIAKVLVKGRDVQFFTVKTGERVDIMARVIKRFESAKPPIFSQVRISSEEIRQYGADSCYCAAVQAADADLGRYL